MPVPRRGHTSSPQRVLTTLAADSAVFADESAAPPPLSNEERMSALLRNLCGAEALRWRNMSSLKAPHKVTLLHRLVAGIKSVLSLL
jgi:hypothetical protein